MPSSPPLSRYLADETATLEFAGGLAKQLRGRELVFLHGQLGAGKTTLARGILRALGHPGLVKSPTYTLLEPYQLGPLCVYHFDLYRIGESAELEFMGMDELLETPGIKLIEWPERAADRLPTPDIEIVLSLEGEGRRVEVSFSA